MKKYYSKDGLVLRKKKSHAKGFFTVLWMIFFYFHLFGQQSSLPCNGFEPWVPATYTVSESHSTTGLGCWEGNILCPGGNVPANVVNANTSDFATGYITGVGSLTLSVKDNTNDYSAGNYAGFVVSSGLFSLGLFSSITITTYLDNVMQEDYQAVDLIGLSSAFLSGPIHIGFETTLSYDEIEITFDNLLGVGSYNVYYAENEAFCAGPSLACNEETPMNKPDFPMLVDYSRTGTSGVSVATVDNPENAVSASTTDYASLIHVAGLLGSSFLTVGDEVTDYPAGTFVGFDIENLTLVSVDVLNYITVTSYLNNVQQESVSGPALLAGVPLLTGSGRYTVGFVTNTLVDKVKITVAQPAGVTLGTTRVYSTIFQSFCEGPEPDCNAGSILTAPTYPVLIDIAQTGLTGAACAGCSILEPGNVIDDDSATYAQIILTAGVLTTGSLAVKDQLTDYTSNTFVGFRIENPNLVDADALTGITVSTYLNGTFQESQTNLGALVTVGSDLLVNDDQEIVGFVTTLPFDEAKISLNNVGAFNIGTTRIHELVITPFCPATIVCDTTYYLNVPEFPVYIDAFRTGVDGVACVACSVVGEENVITADTSDYALITITAGVLSSSSIAVADALYTYPPGTFAGFVIEDLGLLLEAELFQTLTISTYNNGVLQESKSGSDLIDLAVIVLFISDAPGRYNVGFQTTLPFDEVRISVGSLAAAINLVRVYGAFVDTRASNGGDLFCNDGPVANPDLATTTEDTPVIIDVLANDSDMDNPLGVPSVTDGPDHGMATVNADSTITYVPGLNYVGQDTFIYSICDPSALCDTALVVVTVEPQIDTVMYTIPEDDTIQVCSGELTVFDVPATSMSTCDLPSNGTATITGDCVTYEPDPGFNGLDTFCVYVCHPDIPALCDTTIIIIDVTPVNNGPVAEPDPTFTPEDTPVIIDVLANDSDPDDPLGIPAVTDGPDHGSATVNADSTITYTPDSNYVGVDTFIYTICDPGLLCDTALVVVTVEPQIDTVMYTIPEDDTIQVCSGELTVFDVPATSMSTCDLPSNGTATINGDCVTYEPDAGFNGMDTFCVYVCHPNYPALCDTTIIIIDVTPVNNPPDAEPDPTTTSEDTPAIIDVLANDSDPDDPLGIPAVTDGPDHGTATVNPDSTITYTPDLNYVGVDTFIYTICDPGLLCDTALVVVTVEPQIDTVMYTIPEDDTIQVCSGELTVFDVPATSMSTCDLPSNGTATITGDCVTYEPDPGFNGLDTFCVYVCHPNYPGLCDTTIIIIDVTPVNNPPDAEPDPTTTSEDTPAIIDVLANDSDPDDPLGIPAVTDGPDHGTATVNPDSTITYTPDPNYVGVDTFIYTICDPGLLCDTALVVVTVEPQIDTVMYTIPEDDTIQVCSGELTVFDVPATSMSTCNLPSNGTATITGDCVTYEPDPGFNGLDTFCVYVCHPNYPGLCDTTIIIIDVTPVNNPPDAEPDPTTTSEDTPAIIDVLANDSDPDDPLGIPAVTDGPDHGTATVNPDSTITYTPDPNYVGVDTFIYTICDPGLLCDTALVVVTVEPQIDTVMYTIPEDDTIQICSGELTVFDVPATSMSICNLPSNGTATINGDCVTYEPDPGFNGLDTFCVYVCHPNYPGLCDTTIIIIDVTPVNDAPVAEPDSATVQENSSVIIDVLANDSDPDDPLGIPDVIDGPDHGSATVNADSTITYTPDPDYVGVDTFTYAICDPGPLCDTTWVYITVLPMMDTFEVIINCPSDLVLECGSPDYVGQINAWIATATASGGCPGNLTITTDYDGSSVPDLSCDLSGGLTVIFTAADECGDTATCMKTVYLDDSLSPDVTAGVIESCYNTIEEAMDAIIAATTVSDNCTAAEDLAIDFGVASGPACDSIITMTVTDACGNSASATYETMINCQVVRCHVFLEGPYSIAGDSMRTTMNEAHTLPGQLNPSPFIFDAPAGQPYQGAPWNYTGNLGLNYGDGGGMTPYPPDVVDWVLVTVRHNGILPADNIWTCAGWVHKDGMVTFPEDCPGPAINIGDDYYILVQHQNHLGALSPSFVNILCNGAVLEWDFRNSDSYKPVFRAGQKEVEPGVWAMFAANGEQVLSIAAINSTDRTLWKVWQGFLGYSPGDFDLNTMTNSADETVWKNNQNRTSGIIFY